jgi:hypothetical protein
LAGKRPAPAGVFIPKCSMALAKTFQTFGWILLLISGKQHFMGRELYGDNYYFPILLIGPRKEVHFGRNGIFL